MGFIAQEVLDVVPEIVNQDEKTGFYSLSYGNAVALLTEAVKELENKYRSEVEDLRREVSRLSSLVQPRR